MKSFEIIKQRAITLLLVFATGSVACATDLSEVSGIDSFSSDFQNPTLLELEEGTNTVVGEVGAPGSGTLLANGTDGGTDGVYFTLDVPLGFILNQIFVNRYNQLQRGFAIYAEGAQFAPPEPQGPNIFYPFADGALFAGSGDIVPLPPQPLLIGSDNPVDASDGGFNVDALGPGTFAFLIQENQVGATEYELEFVVSALAVGDFDGDGVDIDDWNTFKPLIGGDLTGLSPAARYRAGDFNDDGMVDFLDAHLFAAAFDEANGAGAFAATVPESNSVALAILSSTGIVALHKRSSRKQLVENQA